MKDAYYFSHDSNAKDDPKCVLLIEQLGLEGYGIYWVLIETLRDQPNYKYPVVLIPALARRYNTTAEKMKTVVNSYGLFQIDENDFFSLSLMERMEKLDDKREKARKAGMISAQKRLMLNAGSTDVQQTLNNGSTSKVNKSKVNKIKEEKNKYGEYAHVLLTKKEYENLLSKLGQDILLKCIKLLDEYIEEKGYKSKSHNLTIQKWVVDAVKERERKKQQTFTAETWPNNFKSTPDPDCPKCKGLGYVEFVVQDGTGTKIKQTCECVKRKER